jgi:hypothetical protein
MTIAPGGNVGIGTTTAQSLLNLKKDANSTNPGNSASIVLTNKNTTLNGNIAGGIFVDLYRDVADPCYSGGIWFTRNSEIGNASSSTHIVFGAQQSGGSGLPSEKARIDASGRLLVGTSSSRDNLFNTAYSALFQVESQATANAQASLTSTTAGVNGANLILCHQRSGSVGGNTVVQSDDQLGILSFQGADGTEMVPAASIEAYVDGTPGANDMPGRLVFSTTADGDAGSTERLRITSAGLVGIGTSAPNEALHIASGGARISSSLIGGGASSLGLDYQSSNARFISYGPDVSTQTGLIFLTANSTASTSIERLRITSAGLVGIGTSSPNYQLHVTTDFAVGASGFNQQLTFGNDTIQSLLLGTGYTALKLNPLGGNVGIGAASPGEKLDVIGNIQVGDSGNERGIYVGAAGFSGAFLYQASGDVQLSPRSSYGIKFAPAPGSATEWGRWDNGGRLLVGTSSARSNFFNLSLYSPGIQLEGATDQGRIASIVGSAATGAGGILILGSQKSGAVGGNTAVTNGGELGIVSFQGNDGTEFVEAASIAAYVDGTPGANDMPGRLVFSTTADGASSPTERMRIDNAGALKASTNGTYKFGTGTGEITHNDTTSTIHLVASNTSFTGDAVTISTYRNTNDSTYNFLSCVRQGFAVVLNIRDSGNVLNANNSYGALSDLKLKENIVDASSQWSDIKALQVRNYNFKEGQTHTQIGLIAQEVELISPGLVGESPDRDEDGNDLGTVTKSVNYSVLYMKAVKALQEAMERIETLEARLTAAGIE